MEGMIVAAQQQLTCLYDYIYKDLALTWKDIKKIMIEIPEILDRDEDSPGRGSKEYYEEVLRRFNEQRKK